MVTESFHDILLRVSDSAMSRVCSLWRVLAVAELFTSCYCNLMWVIKQQESNGQAPQQAFTWHLVSSCLHVPLHNAVL